MSEYIPGSMTDEQALETLKSMKLTMERGSAKSMFRYGLMEAECHAIKALEDKVNNKETAFEEGYKQAILDGKTNYSRPEDEIFPMEIVAGKCPFDTNGDCPLRPQGEGEKNDNRNT